MPGGGLRGQHAGRFAKAKSNMALTLKEADSVAPYIPPTSVPREGKRMRGMRRTNRWHHPSKLINCGKLDSVQTETKLRNGVGYRCNLCGFGAFSSSSSVQKHQASQACSPSLRSMERERAKKQYRTMFARVQAGTKTSGNASSADAGTMNCDSNTACANDVGTESVCSTAKALFEPFVEYLESTVDKAYVTRNCKSGRKPPPEWLLKDFVWHRPNPSVLAHATMQVPDARYCPSGENVTECTLCSCPSIVLVHSPLSTLHTFTVSSILPDAR